MKSLITSIYKMIFPPYAELLRKELQDCRSILDLGCGKDSPIRHIFVGYSVGVELFEPYLEESKRSKIHSQYILGDIRNIGFKENSFDAVLALDLIEHLTKEEGINLIGVMEKWANKKVIISTTNGFVWQEGYDNNPSQIHECGWSVTEFKKLGYKIYGIRGWKGLRGYRANLRFTPTLIWQVISDITQKITFRMPKLAFQLLCVKSIE